MKVLRTPDQRFEHLADYPFEPHYYELADEALGSLRMHYVAEGPETGKTVVLLHGQPSWSYLYRHIIPVLADRGFRVIAPDLIGFGRSDKPARPEDYSYARHLGWLKGLFDGLSLDAIHLLCHDWGGMLGLRLVAEQPARYPAVLATNTALPVGTQPHEAFLQWRAYCRDTPDIPVGRIVAKASETNLGADIIAAYDAPFPDVTYKAGVQRFPELVPVALDDPEGLANREAWKRLMAFQAPFLTVFGEQDTMMQGLEKIFIERVPGAANLEHVRLPGGHFIQEDTGPRLGELMADLVENLPV